MKKEEKGAPLNLFYGQVVVWGLTVGNMIVSQFMKVNFP